MKSSDHLASGSEKELASTGTTVTIIGLAAACVACCLPLITPLFVWLGLSSVVTVAAGYWWLGGGIALTGAGLLLLRRRRRSAQQANACGCHSAEAK